MRHADRPQIAHRSPQFAIVQRRIALERDLAHLDGWAFLDDERQGDTSRRQRLHFGANRRKLVTMLAEHLLQHHLRPLDAGRIVLALDRDRDLFLLETIQRVRNGKRVQAAVVDLADGRLLAHIDDQLHTCGVVHALDLHAVEVARVPQGVEVALHHGRVILIARPRI